MWAEYLKCLFILWSLIYKTRVASQPQNQIKVRIGQNVSIPCPLDIPKLIHIGWYRCTLEDDCRNHWDKHRIAHIENKTLVYVDYPNKFELKTNGIFTIIEITPEDDYKVFICKGKEQFSGTVDNVTILKIITEAPKISYTPPEEYNVVQGMSVYLECEADGYPYPWVSWIHKQEVLLTRSKAALLKFRNTTESYHGEYTCHAENPLGNASHTTQVHVIGTNTTDHAITTTDNPKESSEPSSDNLNTEGGCNCVVWQALFGVLLVISGVAVGVLLKLYLNLKRYHHNTSQIGRGDFELVIGHKNLEHCARSEDGIEGGRQVEGTNGVGGDHEDTPLEL